MLCKIPMDLGYDVPRLVLGTNFVSRVIPSRGCRSICFARDVLENQDSSVVCCLSSGVLVCLRAQSRFLPTS